MEGETSNGHDSMCIMVGEGLHFRTMVAKDWAVLLDIVWVAFIVQASIVSGIQRSCLLGHLHSVSMLIMQVLDSSCSVWPFSLLWVMPWRDFSGLFC